LFVVFSCSFVVRGRTLTVCHSGCCDFEEIQSAVDDAVPGDEIDVYDGNWEGAVIIRKYVSLQAKCGSGPACDTNEKRYVKPQQQLPHFLQKSKSSSSSSSTPKNKKSKTKPAPKTPSEPGAVCDRVRITSGPTVSANTTNAFPTTAEWQAGFVVIDTPVSISGFRFLCETLESIADADLGFGVVVQAVNSPGNFGGHISQNSFLECHRAVSLLGAGDWTISNNFFTVGSALNLTSAATEGTDSSQSCNFVYISNEYGTTVSLTNRVAPSGNVVDSNTGIVTGNTAYSDRFYPCSFVGIYGNSVPSSGSVSSPLQDPFYPPGTAAINFAPLANDNLNLPQANQITNNEVTGGEVTVGRAIGVFVSISSFNYIYNNEFSSLFTDVWLDYFACRNTVYLNSFSDCYSDSIVLISAQFVNNITSNLIQDPQENGIHHNVFTLDSSTSQGSTEIFNGADLIIDNTVIFPSACGILIPSPTNVADDFLPDILYNNVASICTY